MTGGGFFVSLQLVLYTVEKVIGNYGGDAIWDNDLPVFVLAQELPISLSASSSIFDGGQYLAKKKPNDYGTSIPLYEVEALTRVMLLEIQKFFESEEGQREFQEWKEKQQDKEKR